MSDQPKRRGRPPKAEADRRIRNTTLRFTEAMWRRLHEASAASGRSFNAEIECRLLASLEAPEPAGSVELSADQVRQIVREEIAAALGPKHTVSFTLSQSKASKDIPVPFRNSSEQSIPVQIFGRDHLPS